MTTELRCPCKSTQAYSECCQPLISEHTLADNAEKLMRSRFSAYALGHFQYVLDTYGSAQRQNLSLADLAEGSEEQLWVNLEINHTNESATPKEVEFSAFYLLANHLYELRELSFFLYEQNKLKYTHGDIIKHEKVADIARNDSCPCQSGKKFKKCCGR